MKNVKIRKTKIHKLFACLLSFAMIFCSLTPTVINAADSDWNISLNWGNLSDGLPDEYNLNIENDGKYPVKLQVTVEYTGANTATYNSEDIQIKLSDIYDMTGLDSYDSEKMILDIGAEEKGSGSGKGDWYYTRSFNTTTKTNDYIFTNKNTINNSFTSTFQLVFTFDDIREYLNSRFSKDITAKLITPLGEITSNKLTFNYTGKKDVYKTEFLEPEKLSWPNPILSLIDSAKWNDYIFINVPIYVEFEDENVVALQEGYHLDLDLPNDIFTYIYKTHHESGSASLFSKTNISYYSTVDTTLSSNTLYYAIALPREKYLKQGTVELGANWYGTYVSETTEQLLSSDTLVINVNDFDYIYSGELYSHIKEEASLTYSNLYREAMEYGYGRQDLIGSEQIWDLTASAVYYGKPMNLILGDDLQYFVYEDNTFRKLNDDEIVIEDIYIQNPTKSEVSYEVWARKTGSSQFELFKNGSLSKNQSYSIDISKNTNRYSAVYVKYLNIEETVASGEYVRISTKIYDNRSLDNNKKITDCYNVSYMSIEVINNDQTISYAQMIEQPVTNIAGMAEDIISQDGQYANIRLRGIDKIKVKTVSYTSSAHPKKNDRTTSSDEENVYLRSGIIHEIIYNYSLLDTTIKSMQYKFEFDSKLKIDLDEILYSPFGNDYWNVKYSKEYIENTENVKIDYEIVDGDNGMTTLFINFDLSNSAVTTHLTDQDQYLFAINLAFYTSLDDYYMLDLEGKEVILRSCHPKSEEIYNEIVGINYTRESTGYSTSYLVYPSVARNSYQGVDKLVSVSENEYSKNLQKVNFNEEYSYKLRISSGETQMGDIVLFDQLENANESLWKGTFKGISFEGIEKAGVDTTNFKVYYSANRNQECSLSSSGWILSDNWTKLLSEVKAIAIDFEGYVMAPDAIIYVEINMSAPSSGIEGEIVKNTSSASYIEYDSADTELNVPLNTITNLPSNITSLILGDAKIDINVSKTWQDDNNIASLRPSAVTVRLWQNGTEIDNKVLNSANNWQATFGNYLKFDDSFKEYEFTITEDEVFGYTYTVTTSTSEKAKDFIITNTLDKEKAFVDIKGSKTWDDFDNVYKLRPNSITVDLYQDDIKIKSVTTNETKEWKYTFEDLPKFKNENELYVYSIKEQVVANYEAEYSSKYLHNGLAITFNENCKTENKYDYLRIYYNLNGKVYVTQDLTGTTFAGETIHIPSHDFYLYWHSDVSLSNYYGYKIDNIESCVVDTENLGYSTSTLPNTTVTELSGKNYPESKHNGYGDKLDELYHYSYDTASLEKTFDIKNTLQSLEKSQELTIGKKLYVDDIWWAHGNPIFIFKVEGRDLFNNEVIKYVSLDFDEVYVKQNKVGSGAQATVTKKTTMKLAPGNYTVSEVQVLRYDLTKIDATNASATTEANASFDLKVNNSGECIFTNRCVNYNNYSHNDIVINNFGE